MPFDSDVALVGTGMAPLAAASHLLSRGKSVLLLNPDRDFFLESSELALNPFLPNGLSAKTMARYSPEEVARELGPCFPGSLQNWPVADPKGFYDAAAPHVRSRSRLWYPLDEALEDFYVEASDAGFNPQILDGQQAARRFPSAGNPASFERGLLVQKKFCDVDVARYRNGVLEFLRERLGSDRVICGASQIESMPGGLRFHAEGGPRTARLARGMLVFWTPRLTSWVRSQCKRQEVTPKQPRGARLWEQWSVVSRDPVDPGFVGIWNKELAVWADGEGAPEAQRLAILRAGPLLDLDAAILPQQSGSNWASSDSFGALISLCQDFFRWDKVTVRSMTPRAIFEWDPETPPTELSSGEGLVRIIPGCDGPLVDVVRAARAACEAIDA